MWTGGLKSKVTPPVAGGDGTKADSSPTRRDRPDSATISASYPFAWIGHIHILDDRLMSFPSPLRLLRSVKQLGWRESAWRFFKTRELVYLLGKEVGKDTLGNTYVLECAEESRRDEGEES